MCRVMSAFELCSDWRSVLMATNSTPGSCASTMRLTALTPAPPTPTTRSTASWVRGTTAWDAVSGSSRPNAGRTSGSPPPIRRSRPSCSTLVAFSSSTRRARVWRRSISSTAGSLCGSIIVSPVAGSAGGSSAGGSSAGGSSTGGSWTGASSTSACSPVAGSARALDRDLLGLGQSDLDAGAGVVGGGHGDLLFAHRLVGGAEQVGEGALAHAGALLSHRGSGPPSPGRGSTSQRSRAGRT